MYLNFFNFSESPFAITPNIDFFCQLKGHQEALNVLLFSLQSGEGFIKIVGEVGSGKTLLCRKLLDSLDKDFLTAYIPNPDLNPIELRKAFARELGLDPALLHDQHELVTLINQLLISFHANEKRVVLLLDEAQALSDESLETLRLLTNFETGTKKLLQVVLFGQPELDIKINQPHLRQLKQRITFSYYLPTLSKEDLDVYLFHRLSKAGHSNSMLFSKKARKALFKSSGGIPRLVNILCHKALLAAYGKGEKSVSYHIMKTAIKDTDSISINYHKYFYMILLGLISFSLLILYVFI